VFALIAFALYGGRVKAVHAWPPLARLYEALHVMPEVEGEGLVFDRISAVAATNDKGVYTLKVTGNIVNLKGRRAKVLPLQTALLKPDGSVFDIWKAEAPQGTVDAYGTIAFETDYPNLPQDIKDIKIEFKAGGK
jgi:hypothetical protein